MKYPYIFIPLLSTIFISSACDKAKNSNNPDPNWPTDSIRTVKSGLNYPWEILWGLDNHIWMTERGGKISKIDPLTGNTVFEYQIPDVVSQGEGGLLGMVLHPDFLNNGFIYVSYNYLKGGTYTHKVVRLSFSNNSISDPLVLIDNIPSASIHNGSRLCITADNKLLVSTGDAANDVAAQNSTLLNGKILRINFDGTIPADNPFPNNPAWTIGHRNPQGIVLVNNTIYTSEHGPSIEDEVNIIERNRNYGWPNVNGPCDGSETTFCTTNNIKEPIWSSGSSTVATSGLDYYNNDRIANWKNSLLLATLKDATLYQLKLSSNGQSVISVTQYFRGNWGRLRDICVSPAGRVYICTSNGGSNDKIIEITK
jgi:aldose sugar dehydrogenase